MSDTIEFNGIAELNRLSEIVDLTEFFSINIWSNKEIRLQGYLTKTTRQIAKDLEIELVYDNEDGYLRGNSGSIILVLSEK